MNDFVEGLMLTLGVIATVFIFAVVSGTIIWGTWDALHSFFPNAPLPSNPSWWLCVKGSWLFSMLARVFLPNFEIKTKS